MRVLVIVLLSFAASAQQSRDPSSPNLGKYRVGVGAAAARCDSTPDPQYTPEARKANIKGEVILSATLDVDGCLRDINVVRSLGYGLDATAVNAVRRWHCKPTIKNGEPTPSHINIELNFDPTFQSEEPIRDVNPCAEHKSEPATPSR